MGDVESQNRHAVDTDANGAIPAIYAQIADILHPVDHWKMGELKATVGDDMVDEWIAQADRQRTRYVHELMAECDGDTRRKVIGYVEPEDPDDPADPFYLDTPERDALLEDPLIAALRNITDQINVLRARQRALIAFAREFPPPGHEYTLDTLASAVGMSTSGIRTSYDGATTANVARMLHFGAQKRAALPDPRWIAARDAANARAHKKRAQRAAKYRSEHLGDSAGHQTRPPRPGCAVEAVQET